MHTPSGVGVRVSCTDVHFPRSEQLWLPVAKDIPPVVESDSLVGKN